MAAELGKTVTLTVNDGAMDAHTAIPKVKSITVPSQELSAVEITHLGSTLKEFLPGLVDPQQLEVEIYYQSTEYTRLIGLKGTSKAWKVTFANGQTATWTGFLVSCAAPVTGAEEPTMIQFKVQLTTTATLA